MPKSSERRARITEAFKPKQASSTAIQYNSGNNDNGKLILQTTARQNSPDTQKQISVAEDHRVDLISDKESSRQASLDQLHELQQRLSASERNLLKIEERYNWEYQALAAKLDDSTTQNAKHVDAREQLLLDARLNLAQVEDWYKQENQALAAKLDNSNSENAKLQTVIQHMLINHSTLEDEHCKLNKYTSHLQNEMQQVRDERDRLVPELQQAKDERDRLIPIVSSLCHFGQCKICHCAMDRPTPLTCGHIFCFECLQEWRKAQVEWVGTATNRFPCPMCRASMRLKNQPIFGLSELITMASEP